MGEVLCLYQGLVWTEIGVLTFAFSKEQPFTYAGHLNNKLVCCSERCEQLLPSCDCLGNRNVTVAISVLEAQHSDHYAMFKVLQSDEGKWRFCSRCRCASRESTGAFSPVLLPYVDCCASDAHSREVRGATSERCCLLGID